MEGGIGGKFSTFSYEIPGQEHLTTVEYYFAAKDNMNQISTLPEGGEGLNPLGNTPPENFFSYRVVIAGTPIINSLSHSFTDTTIYKGDKIFFTVNAEDTTGLELKYKWTKNGEVVSQRSDFTYSTTLINPPVTDEIKLLITNNYKSAEKTFLINVETTTSIARNDLAKVDFNLEQNYPNPFNPSTQISYSIASDGLVQMKVYNLMGEEIISLVDEYKSKGKYEVNFNAANLPSGIYFAQLITDNYVNTIKMNLTK